MSTTIPLVYLSKIWPWQYQMETVNWDKFKMTKYSRICIQIILLMECRLLRTYSQFWKWDITEADSSYLVDTKDIWRELVRHPLDILDMNPSVCSPVLWCVGLLLDKVCIYPDTDCDKQKTHAALVLLLNFSSSPMRIHACAVESILALGTVVGKPNLRTKICNWAVSVALGM